MIWWWEDDDIEWCVPRFWTGATFTDFRTLLESNCMHVTNTVPSFFSVFLLFRFLFCWNVLEQVVPWHDDGRLFARQLSKTRNHRTQATFSIVRKTTENRGPTIIIMYYSRDATGPHQSHSAKKIQYVRGSNVKQIVPKSVSLYVLLFPILFLFCVKSFTCDAWLTDRFRYVRAK